jgi:hypothetical protein
VEGEKEGSDERWEGRRGAERWRRERGRCGTREREKGEISDEGERRRRWGQRGGGD